MHENLSLQIETIIGRNRNTKQYNQNQGRSCATWTLSLSKKFQGCHSSSLLSAATAPRSFRAATEKWDACSTQFKEPHFQILSIFFSFSVYMPTKNSHVFEDNNETYNFIKYRYSCASRTRLLGESLILVRQRRIPDEELKIVFPFKQRLTRQNCGYLSHATSD